MSPPRHFSTTTRVHPAYLPHLAQRTPVLVSKKVIPPLLVAGVAAIAIVGIRDAINAAHPAHPGAMRDATTPENIGEPVEEQNANVMMSDAFASRSSLRDLENAMRVYEDIKRR